MRVKKRSGNYQEFDRRKLRGGIERACEKRPVSAEEIDTTTDRIVSELENEYGREVTWQQIGELVMRHLRKLDEVAYVRFASVYRQFHDAEQFIHEIERMVKNPHSAVAKRKPGRRK
jgi:transcriptional repressor NrdR